MPRSQLPAITPIRRASPGLTVHGGGLFTAFPVTLSDSVIAGDTPDQCFGC